MASKDRKSIIAVASVLVINMFLYFLCGFW